MTRTEKENLVPVWERITISLEEAAAYSGIGVRKLRDMTDKPECNYVIWVGNRRMIKRKKFDEYLESAYTKRDGAVMNDFVREFFEDQPELLRRYERNEARYILQLPKNYDTISIDFGIDKNEMKRLVIALGKKPVCRDWFSAHRLFFFMQSLRL